MRERDSRTGLTAALAEEREAGARVSHLTTLLADLSMPAVEDLLSFTARQHSAAVLGEELTRARADLESARRIVLAARDRWRADRTRLAAVESLVERRAAVLRAEERRRETRELDAVAEDLWRRRAASEEAS